MRSSVLVGCGTMAAGWAKALATPALADRVRIVGIVDVDLAAATRFQERFGLGAATVGTDLDEVLARTGADIVFDVAVPTARKDIVLTALKHGCDVLTEKPMAASLEEAQEIVAAAKAAGKVHAVTQNRRFKESIRRVRAFLKSGAIGQVSSLHCDFFVGAHFGGFRDLMEHVLLLDMAIHTLDAARFMSGTEAEAAYCLETNPAGSWYAHGASAYAIFEMSGDVVFTYRGSWSAEGANTSWEAAWRIVGSKGTLLWDGESGLTANVVDGDEGFFRPLRPVEIPPWTDEGKTGEHAGVLRDFLDALDSGATPESAGTDNIKSLAMVFAAIESARTRQRVLVAS